MEENFEKAAEHLSSLVATMSSENLLYFYARYKQAKFGPCDTPKPGFFDFQGKQKWTAWNDLRDMSKEQAMNEYVDKLDEIDPGWIDQDPSESSGKGWVSVSSMVRPENEDIDDDSKTICDWIKDGDVEHVKAKLTDRDVAEYRDQDGLGLIHWAVDRGDLGIVKLIAESPGFEVNLRDADGQTALHYACSNGHYQVVKYLLSIEGIDTSIKDDDGILAKQNIDDENSDAMHALFS